MNILKARLLAFLVVVALLALFPGSRAQARVSVIYVNQAATGDNDGASWEDAYTDLQTALMSASSGNQIWVAQGTYKPTPNTYRSVSFGLPDGVGLYGGFAGNETSFNQRDPVGNVTTLSADIGTAGVTADNSYHVIFISSDVHYAVVDGFTITGGNADQDGGYAGNGGGISAWTESDANLRFRNLIFTRNYADCSGAGLYIWDGNVALDYVTFLNHKIVCDPGEVGSGAAIFVHRGNVTINHGIFGNNTASVFGGAIRNLGTLTISNSTFYGNKTTLWTQCIGGGGAIYNDGTGDAIGILTVVNSTFYNNDTQGFGGAIFNDRDSILTVLYSTFSQNDSVQGGGAVRNIGDMRLGYSILANSLNGEDCMSDQGDFSGTHNLIENNDTDGCGTPLMTVDPRLAALRRNGGFTTTMALLPSSPARDAAGNDSTCPAQDQRGKTRPQGSHCDLGAYEAVPNTALGQGTYDDADPAWSYAGHWVSFNGNGPYNQTLHYTDAVGDSAEFVFHGTQFTLTYTASSTRGSIEVYLDEVLVGTINAHSSATHWQQTWDSPTFASGDHILRLVHAGGGTNIDVDAITIP